MSSIFTDRSGDESLVRQTVAVAQPYFALKPGHVREAVARAFGFRTHASLIAHREKQVDWEPLFFDHAGFVDRLSDLLDREGTAYATGVLTEGVSIHIEIVKHPPERQRADRYTDVHYAISVDVHGISDEVRERDNWFVLPEFFKRHDELYRVDSDWNYRADRGENSPRRKNGKGLTAKLAHGKWSGGLFVYASAHQQNDELCLKSVRSALARAILPTVTSGVRCDIYKPATFDFGAWRVDMTLGPGAVKFIGDSELTFDIPVLSKRRLYGDDGFRYRGPQTGKFVDGRWSGILYTNGVQEDENPTSIAAFRRGLLKSVYQSLEEAGWRFISSLPPGQSIGSEVSLAKV